MRRLFSVISGVGVIIIAIILIAPFVLPANKVKRELVGLIERSTGWQVALHGDVSISLFPDIALKAENIEISPADNPPLLVANEVRFSLSLQKLIGGTIAIGEIALEHPFVKLALNADGRPSFLREVPATSPSTAPEQNNLVTSLFDTLDVKQLAVENARIEVRQPDEPAVIIENLSLSASLPDAHGALMVSGSADFYDETLAINGSVEAFKTFLDEGKTALNATLNFRGATLVTSGSLDINEADFYQADIEFSINNLRDFSRNQALKPATLSANGRVIANNKNLHLRFEEGRLADGLFFIDLNVNTAGPRPSVSGNLDFGKIDLEQLLDHMPPARNSKSNNQGLSIENGDDDLSVLQTVDIYVALTTGMIVSGDHKIKDFVGKLRLNNGKANLIVEEIKVAGGIVKGSLYADTGQSPLTTFGTLRADRLSTNTLLALAPRREELLERIDGLLATDIRFGFQGMTVENMIQTLNAKGTLQLFDASFDNLGLAEPLADPRADQMNNVDVTVTFDDLTNPLKVRGEGDWRGERLSVTLSADPNALLLGKNANVQVGVSSSLAEIGFDGIITPAFPLKGRLSAKGGSLRAFAQWLNLDLPPGDGYNMFDISTALEVTPTAIKLTALQANLDDLKGNGDLTIHLDSKPTLIGQFNFDLFDVDPYLATTAARTKPNRRKTGTQQPTVTREFWSNEALDFGALHAANIELTANVKELRSKGLSLGPLTLKAAIQNGRLNASLSEMSLYDGLGSAQFGIDTTGTTPLIHLTLNASNVSALPFLSDGAGFHRIAGRLAIDLDITAQGTTQAALMSTLSGTSNFAFSDGALRGIDIARLMRALTQSSLYGWDNLETAKTDFSAFEASFVLQDGVAINDDLRLLGPLVRVSGRGSANMRTKSLDYRVQPKVVASLEGQGGRPNLSGFSVPIIIKGAWEKPRIYPDIAGFLENPVEGIAKLRALGGGLEKIANGKPAEIINQLASVDEAAGETSLAATAERALYGVFRNQKKNTQNDAASVALGVLGVARQGLPQKPEALKPVSANGIPVPRAKPLEARPAIALGRSVNSRLRNHISNTDAKPIRRQAAPAREIRPANQLIKGIDTLLNGNQSEH